MIGEEEVRVAVQVETAAGCGSSVLVWWQRTVKVVSVVVSRRLTEGGDSKGKIGLTSTRRVWLWMEAEDEGGG